MTKQQLIDLVISNLSAGAVNAAEKSAYHPKIVEQYLSLAFESLMNGSQNPAMDLMNEMGITNNSYDFLTKAYLLDVEYDTMRDKYFSSIPVGIMSMDNNSGIRMIFPVKSEESAFIPRSQTDNFLMSDLAVSNLTTLVRYTYEGNNKVYYSGNTDLLCRLHKAPQKVYAKLAVKFSALENTDELNIPYGKNDALFQYVWEFISREKKQDIVNDTTIEQP